MEATAAWKIQGKVPRTSRRARWCLVGMVTGFLAILVIGGAALSPLVTPLPEGALPPAWTRVLATGLGLSGIGRTALSILSWFIVAALVGMFVGLILEARRGHVRPTTALGAALVSLALATAGPLLLSRDVISYAVYGRIFAVYRGNPYVSVPAEFPHDAFLKVASAQWLHTRSLYGPTFTLISGLIVRAWSGSPGAVILAFKVLGGVAVALAVVLTARSVHALRPDRVSLAIILVGLNPVIVLHTVGGGHVDALLAPMLAGALALAIAASRARRASFHVVFSAAVTLLLTIACMTKVTVAPILVLWCWWVIRDAKGTRVRTAALHLSVVAGASAGLFAPFFAGWRTFTPIATFGGIETWASPVAMIANGAQHVTGSAVGTGVHIAVEAVFAAIAIVLLRRLGSSAFRHRSGLAEAAAFAWGPALLLVALTTPFFLPWYAAWFVPFLALIPDERLMWTGVVASGVLALTLIPADPAHGYTSWEVMSLVHLVAAPVMCVLLVVGWLRILKMTSVSRPGPALTTLVGERSV
ncbi:MAG: hypothetical protein QOI81_417 [Actinomycetota bacterium]|nr:hypothetical protein [Actinomycetota bacterium]